MRYVTVFCMQNIRNKVQFGLIVVRVVIVVILTIPVLLPTLVLLSIGLYIASLPRKAGRLSFSSILKELVFYRVCDRRELRLMRDDMMHVLANILDPQVDYEEFDRWGALRGIDEAREESKETLRDGELVITFTGSILALIVGNLFNLFYGGVILTIVALFFSLLVVVRVAIIDELSYHSTYLRHESPESLMLMKSWNEGVIKGRSSVGIAILSILIEYDGWGYRLGMDILDEHFSQGKWKAE